MPYSVVFFGTSDFAVPSLKVLLADLRFSVKAVVTQPDQPVGRHQVMTASPIKIAAQENNLAVFQFEKIKTDQQALKTLADFKADFFVVASYGQIIPQPILDLPKLGSINVHGSLLPRWRGASCVQAAIAAGDTKSGITIMLMDALMDHGPIIFQASTPIKANDTGGSLHDELAELGSKSLPEVLVKFAKGDLEAKDQDHAKATTCKLLKREDGKIDWAKSAIEIERMIRAFNPWPSAWTEWKGKRVKVLNATIPLRQPASGGTRGKEGVVQNTIGFKPYNPDFTKLAQNLRKNMTPAEKRFWYEILNRFKEYKFLRQKPIADFILDFYCSELMLGIEIDGDDHNLKKEADNKRTEALERMGICVIRFANRDIISNLEGVYDTLAGILDRRKKELDNPSSLPDRVLQGALPLSGEPYIQNGSLMVACGDGNALEILELQPEGKKPMTAKEYMLGHGAG